MSLIDWFAARRKDQFVGKVSQDTDEGDGLWVKCSECSQVAYRKDLISNFNVCSNCGHHNRINSDERINIIADKNSFKEFDNSLSPTDPLGVGLSELSNSSNEFLSAIIFILSSLLILLWCPQLLQTLKFEIRSFL